MNKEIILIEDDQWLADSYVSAFRAQGIEVTQFSTAHEAMSHINKHIPSLIVADIMLGDHNSFTLFHELQSYSDTAPIPIILCTSLSTRRLKKADMKSYGIAKVFDKALMTPDQLVEAVREYVPDTGRAA
jgi:DNA-binding response OmpR family regulator